MKKAIFGALVLFLAVQAIVVAQPAPRPLYAAEVSYTYNSTAPGGKTTQSIIVAGADEADAERRARGTARFIRWIPQAQYTEVCYRVLAVAYNETGQYDNAIDNANKAIQLNPNYGDIYLERGVAYMEKGNYRQARADCNKVMEMYRKYSLDTFFWGKDKFSVNFDYRRMDKLDAELKKKGY
jgi:tetratricopeptide (TPR) repeat protein